MSMYPSPQSPYAPPGVPQYYPAPVDPLRPARRASLMMFIIGPLILLAGTCIMTVPAMMRMAPAGPDRDQMMQKLQETTHGRMDLIADAGVIAFVVGLGLLILAFFVRRGGRTSCVIAAVVTGLLGVYFVLNLVGSVTEGSIPGVCMSVLLAGVMGLTVAWLIQAIRASGNVDLARQQYAAQYWHYQQTMQAYANAGYGYGTQPHGAQPGQVPMVPPVSSPAPPVNPENPSGSGSV